MLRGVEVGGINIAIGVAVTHHGQAAYLVGPVAHSHQGGAVLRALGHGQNRKEGQRRKGQNV